MIKDLMNEEVRLVTGSGRWSKTVNRLDPVFSSLIPDLEDLPKEFTLSGSVGEILEEQWKYYEMLERIHERYLLERRDDPAYIRYYRYSSIVNTSFIMRLKEEGLSIVHYSSISRLSMLINIPNEYRRYIFVDENVPEIERKSHYRSLSELDWEYFSGRDYDITQKLIRDAWGDIEDVETITQVTAHLHNGQLIALSLNRDLSVYDVDWEEVSQVIRGKASENDQNTIDNLLGRGELASRTYSIYFTSKSEPCKDLSNAVTGKHLMRIYDSVLDVIDDQVEPLRFGLNSIADGQFDYGYTHSFVSEVHEHLIRSIQPISRVVREVDFDLLSRIFYHTVGKKAMIRILLSLLHYMNIGIEGENERRRVNSFCNVLERDIDILDKGYVLPDLPEKVIDYLDPRLIRV